MRKLRWRVSECHNQSLRNDCEEIIIRGLIFLDNKSNFIDFIYFSFCFLFHIFDICLLLFVLHIRRRKARGILSLCVGWVSKLQVVWSILKCWQSSLHIIFIDSSASFWSCNKHSCNWPFISSGSTSTYIIKYSWKHEHVVKHTIAVSILTVLKHLFLVISS